MTCVKIQDEVWVLESILLDALTGLFKDEYLTPLNTINTELLASDYKVPVQDVEQALRNINGYIDIIK